MRTSLPHSATLALLGLLATSTTFAEDVTQSPSKPIQMASKINLNGQIVGTPTITSSADGGAKIKFEIKIENTGKQKAQGQIRLKPFLVPEKTTGAWPEHGGRVLDAQDVKISIEPASSQAVTYEHVLPNISKATYYVAVIINSMNGIITDQSSMDSNNAVVRQSYSLLETTQLDNVTDLVALGEVEVRKGGPKAPAIDIGTLGEEDAMDVQAALDFVTSNGSYMEKGAGVVRHDLNTYSLSPVDGEPDFGAGRANRGMANNSGKLFARFMFADTKTKKVYTTIYQNDYNQGIDFGKAWPEKSWFLVTWHNPENIAAPGETPIWRRHDTYIETTRFDGVPPGDYKYLVLINAHDFPETDVHNNLSVYDTSIRAARPKATANVETSSGTVTMDLALPELWLVGAPGSAPATEGIGWTTDYSSAHLKSAKAGADAPWAKLEEMDLALTSDTLAPLKASVQALGTAGTRKGGLMYEISSLASSELFGVSSAVGEFPITYFVQEEGKAPALEFEVPTLEVQDTYDSLVANPIYPVKISNPGKSELQWKALDLPSWLSVEPKEGSIAAGGSVELKLSFDPRPLNRGEQYSSQLMLMTNIASGAAGVRRMGVDFTLGQ